MSMTAARMQPLLQLADTREQEAMRKLAERQATLATQEQRLADLRGYLGEYEQRDPAGKGVVHLRNSFAFVAKLREAISSQQRVVDAARNALDTERGHWLAQKRDLGVLEQLAASYRGREQRALERRSQNVMDEAASRRVAMRLAQQS